MSKCNFILDSYNENNCVIKYDKYWKRDYYKIEIIYV